ncbi:hypothetical protein MIDIC_60002 [Alphaproteobacteria bacterium]
MDINYELYTSLNLAIKEDYRDIVKCLLNQYSNEIVNDITILATLAKKSVFLGSVDI